MAKHETALGVEHLDVEHFSMKGESIDFSNYATQDDVNGIELKNIDGVYDNSKPNLYLTSQRHTQRLMESNLSLLQMQVQK